MYFRRIDQQLNCIVESLFFSELLKMKLCWFIQQKLNNSIHIDDHYQLVVRLRLIISNINNRLCEEERVRLKSNWNSYILTVAVNILLAALPTQQQYGTSRAIDNL